MSLTRDGERDLVEKVTAISTEQLTIRKQVLEPMKLDLRETRDVALMTKQAFDKHVEDSANNNHCKYPGINEKVAKLDITVSSYGKVGKRVMALVMLFLIPIIGTLVYSVRAEETMRHGIHDNTKASKLLKIQFDDHVAQQKRDISAIIRAIDDVPQEVAKTVNYRDDDELSDEDIEKMVSKLPTTLDKRRARDLLRKIRAVQE